MAEDEYEWYECYGYDGSKALRALQSNVLDVLLLVWLGG